MFDRGVLVRLVRTQWGQSLNEVKVTSHIIMHLEYRCIPLCGEWRYEKDVYSSIREDEDMYRGQSVNIHIESIGSII